MKKYEEIVNDMIEWGNDNVPEFKEGAIRDKFHSFEELYEFRKMYNAALFNEWAINNKYDVHKSTKHYDGEDCFGGGWFVVVAILPKGQITNHYKIKDWNLFQIPAQEKAKYKFDNHTGLDTIDRLRDLLNTYSNGITAIHTPPEVKSNSISFVGQTFSYQDFTGRVMAIKDGMATLVGENRNGQKTIQVNVNSLNTIYKFKTK